MTDKTEAKEKADAKEPKLPTAENRTNVTEAERRAALTPAERKVEDEGTVKRADDKAARSEDRRTDHLSGAPGNYGGYGEGPAHETGNEAFQRMNGGPGEIGIPTSSADTEGMAEIKRTEPNTGEALESIGIEQQRVAAGGGEASAETAGEGDNVEDKAAMRGKLPDDFPGVAALRAENLDTYGKLRSHRGSFTDISGIGESTEAKIREAAGLDAAPEADA